MQASLSAFISPKSEATISIYLHLSPTSELLWFKVQGFQFLQTSWPWGLLHA